MTIINQAQASAAYVHERSSQQTVAALREVSRRLDAFARLYTSPDAREAFGICQQVIKEVSETEAQR